MSIPHPIDEASASERRRYPRYDVGSGVTVAIEDASLRESIGIGEPRDISIGGVRVHNLPKCPSVRIGDRLDLLVIDCEDALSLHGEVVHHATSDTFGVEFYNLTSAERVAVGGIIDRLHP